MEDLAGARALVVSAVGGDIGELSSDTAAIAAAAASAAQGRAGTDADEGSYASMSTHERQILDAMVWRYLQEQGFVWAAPRGGCGAGHV